jgi:hypothetical protein
MVRLDRLGGRHSRSCAVRLADHLEPGGRKQPLRQLAEGRVVVNDQDRCRHVFDLATGYGSHW